MISHKACVIAALTPVFAALLSISISASAETSISPYIDQLKQDFPKETAPDTTSSEDGQPFINSVKQKMKSEESANSSAEPYIDQLRQTDPNVKPDPANLPSYTEQEKAKLQPAPKLSAIQEFKEGHSELKARREGEIHHAAGLRFGASQTRDIVAQGDTGTTRTFTDVYGDGFTPDLTFFYEYQPFHSEWYGNIGLVATGGVSFKLGQGKFSFPVPKPTSVGGSTLPTGNFGTSSQTTLRFLTFPVTVGLDYRFNLLRVLRPYVQAGPSLIGYFESRSDEKNGNRGNSRGLYFSGGVAILMDWLDKTASWDLYQQGGVKHFYITLDYTRLSTFSGDVRFATSGLSAGLTYEF